MSFSFGHWQLIREVRFSSPGTVLHRNHFEVKAHVYIMAFKCLSSHMILFRRTSDYSHAYMCSDSIMCLISDQVHWSTSYFIHCKSCTSSGKMHGNMRAEYIRIRIKILPDLDAPQSTHHYLSSPQRQRYPMHSVATWDLGERAQWESTFSLLPIAAKEKSICFE